MPTENNSSVVTCKRKTVFILVSGAILLLTLVSLAELLLFIFEYDSAYIRMQSFTMKQAKWWTCDSINGPRYLSRKADADDSILLKNESWYYNRLKIVNNEGYHDRDDFRDIPVSNDSLRILFAGDSFTWGASADVDSSYVEVFERDIRNVYPSIVWNTGIPATGTNHALFTTKKFLPLQKSNLVILGFYINDFKDNLLNFDKLVFTNFASCYNTCDYDKDFKPYNISRREAYKRVTGSYPYDELNVFQKVIIRSRFFSFVGEINNRLIQRMSGNKKRIEEEEYKRTKEYLRQLKMYTSQNNADLIVFIIPAVYDVKNRGSNYLKVMNILDELKVTYFEKNSLFIEKDYFKRGGEHWKNSGHILAGHALSNFVIDFINKKYQLPK